MYPDYFEARERELLGDRFDSLFAAPEAPARGLTVNGLRCTPEWLTRRLDAPLTPSPFCPNGLVLGDSELRLGKHPYHHAGALSSRGRILPAGAFGQRPGGAAGGAARPSGAGHVRRARRQEQPAGCGAGRAGGADEQRVRARPRPGADEQSGTDGPGEFRHHYRGYRPPCGGAARLV